MARPAATLLLTLALASASAAFAQTGTGEAVPTETAPAEAAPAAAGYDANALSDEGFRPATDGGDAESIPGGQLMLAAYMVFFVLLAFYTTRLAQRHTAVQAELASLRRAMEDLDDRLDSLDGGTQG